MRRALAWIAGFLFRRFESGLSGYLRVQIEQRDRELSEARQSLALAMNEIDCLKLNIDGLTLIVEKYRQQQEAEARIYAAKAQPIKRHDDNPLSASLSE